MTKKPTTKPPPPADEDVSDWARDVWGDMFGLGTRPPASPQDDSAAEPVEDAAPAGKPKNPRLHRRQR